MMNLQIIGHLGADCESKNENGREYVQFRVAHSRKFTSKTTGEIKEETTWVTCFMNGRQEKLTPFLRKGSCVFCQGEPTLRVYDSEKARCKVAGISINVRTLELVGGQKKQEEEQRHDDEEKPF